MKAAFGRFFYDHQINQNNSALNFKSIEIHFPLV